MKLVNFASLDPIHRQRGVRGLANASHADREIWNEFHSDWAALAVESEIALARLGSTTSAVELQVLSLPSGPTEAIRMTRTRLVQRFFRNAVLASYDFRCAICDLDLLQLIVASHIIPWRANEQRRADPTNGLALCALHDRSFDCGLIAISESLKVLVSSVVDTARRNKLVVVGLEEFAGHPLRLPSRFLPDVRALEFHRNQIFLP